MRPLISRLMLTIFLLGCAGPAFEIAFADQYSCFLQAPDQDVYVRVFSVDSFGDQQVEIWSGVIPSNQQQRIISNTAMIRYDHQNRPNGPFEGQTQQPCGDGGIIQILP
ncbi:MAG: hypothetical protein WBV95_19805 [Desulfobacterales bacterium]